MIRKFLLAFIFACLLGNCASAIAPSTPSKTVPQSIQPLKTTLPMTAPAPAQITPSSQPQPVDFSSCNKFFKLDSQKLFYLTLAAANANRFTINEIQSKSGYVLFSVGQKQFLAKVINVDAKNSMLKITPSNNVYFFPVGIVQNMFKYIELNANTPVEKLNIL